MSKEAALRDLLDRWLRVWHHGEYDLVAGCVAPQYIRHDAVGDRVVTRETYAAEIATTRKALTDLHFIVHDQTLQGDLIWIRTTLRWTDKNSGELRTIPSLQVYRIEDGKFAETWLLSKDVGAAWSDFTA